MRSLFTLSRTPFGWSPILAPMFVVAGLVGLILSGFSERNTAGLSGHVTLGVGVRRIVAPADGVLLGPAATSQPLPRLAKHGEVIGFLHSDFTQTGGVSAFSCLTKRSHEAGQGSLCSTTAESEARTPEGEVVKVVMPFDGFVYFRKLQVDRVQLGEAIYFLREASHEPMVAFELTLGREGLSANTPVSLRIAANNANLTVKGVVRDLRTTSANAKPKQLLIALTVEDFSKLISVADPLAPVRAWITPLR